MFMFKNSSPVCTKQYLARQSLFFTEVKTIIRLKESKKKKMSVGIRPLFQYHPVNQGLNLSLANIALKSGVWARGDGIFERIRIYRERGWMQGQPEKLHRNSNHVIGRGSGVLLCLKQEAIRL